MSGDNGVVTFSDDLGSIAMSTTAAEIADWMTDIIDTERRVAQTDMVDAIEAKFGSDWIYVNDNGHPSIDRAVLREFRKSRREEVKWDREARAWYVEASSPEEAAD